MKIKKRVSLTRAMMEILHEILERFIDNAEEVETMSAKEQRDFQKLRTWIRDEAEFRRELKKRRVEKACRIS